MTRFEKLPPRWLLLLSTIPNTGEEVIPKNSIVVDGPKVPKVPKAGLVIPKRSIVVEVVGKMVSANIVVPLPTQANPSNDKIISTKTSFIVDVLSLART